MVTYEPFMDPERLAQVISPGCRRPWPRSVNITLDTRDFAMSHDFSHDHLGCDIALVMFVNVRVPGSSDVEVLATLLASCRK